MALSDDERCQKIKKALLNNPKITHKECEVQIGEQISYARFASMKHYYKRKEAQNNTSPESKNLAQKSILLMQIGTYDITSMADAEKARFREFISIINTIPNIDIVEIAGINPSFEIRQKERS